MDHAAQFGFMREILVFLAAAGIIVPFLCRIGIPPILGYLCCGLAVGPWGLVRLADQAPFLAYIAIAEVEAVAFAAELGVVFLLFLIGLHLSPRRLWSIRRLVFGLGTAQLLATGAAVAAIALAMGIDGPGATVLAAAFAMSSTAAVMQILTDRRELGTQVGRSAFAILLLQDLAVVPALLLVGSLSGGRDIVSAVAAAVGLAVVAVGTILLIGRFALRPLYRLGASTGSRDVFLAISLLAVVGTAEATQLAGLSMALGAFLAGLMLAETEYRAAIEADLEPFKGLLMGVFFISVGMRIDPTRVIADPLPLLLLTAGLMALKAAIVTGLVLAFRLTRDVAFEAGPLVSQAGEFGFVVVGAALAGSLLDRETAQTAFVVIGLTLALTPLVSAAGRHFAQKARAQANQGAAEQSVAEGLSDHVIIAGFGRVGQTVARVLELEGIPWVALDRDPAIVGRCRGAGLPTIFGQADRPEILELAGAPRASLIVVSVDDEAATLRTVEAIRRRWPDLPVHARIRTLDGGRALARAGVAYAVPDAVEVSLRLSGSVLQALGAPAEAAEKRLESFRVDLDADEDPLMLGRPRSGQGKEPSDRTQ